MPNFGLRFWIEPKRATNFWYDSDLICIVRIHLTYNTLKGIVAIPLSDVSGDREFFKWLPLQKKKASNDITGDIQVKISFQYADGYRPGSARGRSGRDRSGSHNNNNDDDDDDDPDDEQSMREDDMGPKPVCDILALC